MRTCYNKLNKLFRYRLLLIKNLVIKTQYRNRFLLTLFKLLKISNAIFDFRCHVYSNFDFFKFFSPLINKIFKTNDNCYCQIQLIGMLCKIIYVTRDL